MFTIEHQKEKLIQMIKNEIGEMNIGRVGIERLLSNDGEWLAKIIGILRKTAGSPFENCKTTSLIAYPPDYHGAKPIDWQINEVAKTLRINGNKAHEYAKTLTPLIEGFEYFAIPRYPVLGVRRKSYEQEYLVALEVLFSLIPREHSIAFFKDDFIQSLRMRDRTKKGIAQLEKKQPESDILIVPINLGMQYRGFADILSESLFEYNEAGVWTFAMLTIVGITHPELLVSSEYLQTSCSGDKSNPYSDCSPSFFIRENKLDLGQSPISFPSANCGAGSFLF